MFVTEIIHSWFDPCEVVIVKVRHICWPVFDLFHLCPHRCSDFKLFSCHCRYSPGTNLAEGSRNPHDMRYMLPWLAKPDLVTLLVAANNVDAIITHTQSRQTYYCTIAMVPLPSSGAEYPPESPQSSPSDRPHTSSNGTYKGAA